MIAGPTELGIIVDSSADPELVAYDLVSQAEHSNDTMCFVITTSKSKARQIQKSLEKLIPNEFTRSDYQAGAKLISEMLSKSGITSVTDAGTGVKSLQSYHDAYNSGELKTRIYCMIRDYAFDEVNDSGKKTGYGDEWVRIGALKLACDGSISERTARLSKPYIGRPNDFGIIVHDEEHLYEEALKAHLNDWQIGIHANGDVGIDIALNVYERLQKEKFREDPRFRLEHCTVINKSLIERIKALNAIPNPNLINQGDKNCILEKNLSI